MHNNFFFLRQLSEELNKALQGYTIVSCFSQDKDELVIEFNNRAKSFFIKACLQPDFCCLAFPTQFNRARKNSVDLFPKIILKEVKSIRQFRNERSFGLELSDGFLLLFKMHGNRANVILFQNESAISIFRNHLKTDLNLTVQSLDREMDWTYDYFKKHRSGLKNAFFTLGSDQWEYLEQQGLQSYREEEQWEVLQKFYKQLNSKEFYIVRKNGNIALSLFPTGDVLEKYSSPIQALNNLFLLKMKAGSVDGKRQEALKVIHEKEKQSIRYINKNKTLLQSLLSGQQYQLWAEVIMANLHQIKKGEEKVILDNYFNPGERIEIKLKKDLSPQKNAEAYYRKAKNQKIEIEKLNESIRQKEGTLMELQSLKLEIEKAGWLPSGDSKILNSTKDSVRLPYKEVEHKGFLIRIGKSAADNDELTLKYAHKEDLWLHAKDVSGSHVVVKHRPGKTFPKDVIERAAELAAFHSKRKGESLCPVAVTPKKFVRKRKGDPPGLVVVEKEKVIMVEPRGF